MIKMTNFENANVNGLKTGDVMKIFELDLKTGDIKWVGAGEPKGDIIKNIDDYGNVEFDLTRIKNGKLLATTNEFVKMIKILGLVVDFSCDIYYMPEFNRVVSGLKPIELAKRLSFEFETTDNYFSEDNGGWFDSFSDIDDAVIDFKELSNNINTLLLK